MIWQKILRITQKFGWNAFACNFIHQIFHIFNFTVIKLFILSIITVRVMIAVKVWMDADTLVVFHTLEVIWVCAGRAAIAGVLAGFWALMRVPVVTGVVVSQDFIKSTTVILISLYTDPRADWLVKFFNKFLFCAGLVHGECSRIRPDALSSSSPNPCCVTSQMN